MSRYFVGTPANMGVVTAHPAKTFAELCASLLTEPVRLPFTRDHYWSLSAKERSHVKRVPYLTPAAFDSSPCQRVTERATRCNLLFLDVDDATEARRLLSQRWPDVLGDLGHVVWHTVSSTPENPRLRVMVNAEGIPAPRYADAVRSIAELIGLTAVTHESRVPVQPMFLPTVFADQGIREIAGL